MRRTHITLGAMLMVAFASSTLLAQGQPVDKPIDIGPGDIAPPGELNLEAPQAEVLPAPNGRREGLPRQGGILSGRDLDLGQLQREFGPPARRFLNRNGERGTSFGLDMAERGINFGLRFVNGQASPSEARAFGQDMGRRGRAFGLEMRDEVLELGDELGEKTKESAPQDGRDSKFEETPGDITIEAPPLPLGQIYGRNVTTRPVKFRREF